MSLATPPPAVSETLYAPLLPRPYLDDVASALTRAQRIAIACHVNPDGDCLGSMLALGLALQTAGKDVILLSHDPVPATLSFLPGADQIVQTTERGEFDLAVVVDAGDLTRVGSQRAIVEAAPLLIDIDHHVTGGVFGQLRLLDATAAATAEIIYDVLLSMQLEITRPIAQCLLCGLLTDTGSFRFPNTTPRTMQIAAEMLRHGASSNEIAEHVFENKPFVAQKLLGLALGHMSRTDDGRIVWSIVTQADFAALGVGDELTDGIMGPIRSVQGASVAFLMREMPTGKLRVSLRTRAPWDVSLVAARFGGGGHRLASGCTLEGLVEDAATRLIAAIETMLDETVSPPL